MKDKIFIALSWFYFAIAIVSFGHSYNHTNECNNKKLYLTSESECRSSNAIMAAIFWPFYLSIEVQE